jgi:hypothetical protein
MQSGKLGDLAQRYKDWNFARLKRKFERLDSEIDESLEMLDLAKEWLVDDASDTHKRELAKRIIRANNTWLNYAWDTHSKLQKRLGVK